VKKSKKIIAALTSIAMVGLLMTGCSQAKAPTTQEKAKSDYPTKPIEMTVGFAAGGGADLVTRITAEGAKKYLPNGQSIMVSNKTGASGSIQLAEIFQTKPDGYKLGSVTTGNIIMQPALGKAPYKATDFEPIALLNSAPNLLVVRSDAPFNTFDEFLEFAKKNPDKFTYGTAGVGDTKHVAMEALNFHFGIKTKQVSFDGSAQSLTALLGGHIMGALVMVQEAKPHTDSGKVKVLANIGSTKTDVYKDAAFPKDKGYTGFDTWTAIVAPKGTPKEIINVLADAIKKTLDEPQVIADFKKAGTEPAYAGPEELKKIIESSYKTAEETVKKAGLVK
jgi:tripartite-type tricarboxylate transporter receptor subunit TctC